MHKPDTPAYFKPVKLGQPVRMLFNEIDSFPPSSNPFHHDYVRMGAAINSEVVIMFTTPKEGESTNDMIFVNTVTGQRWQMIPMPVEPEYVEVLRLSTDERQPKAVRVTLESGEGRSVRVEPKLTIFTVVKDDDDDGYGDLDGPPYIHYDRFVVLESFLTKATVEDLAAKLEEVAYSSDESDFTGLANRMVESYREEDISLKL